MFGGYNRSLSLKSFSSGILPDSATPSSKYYGSITYLKFSLALTMLPAIYNPDKPIPIGRATSLAKPVKPATTALSPAITAEPTVAVPT